MLQGAVYKCIMNKVHENTHLYCSGSVANIIPQYKATKLGVNIIKKVGEDIKNI